MDTRVKSGFFLGGMVGMGLMVAWVVGAQGPLRTADGAPEDGEAKGKRIFLANKCNSCHEIAALGIGKEKAPEEEEEEAEEGDVLPPDLSDVGTRRDAAWLVKWLRKEEKIEGRKHMKPFKGAKEDLEPLATWMAGLKHPAAGGK